MADVIVIGGGIAGISAAAELEVAGADVTLLEAERQLAYHTTGRSAALYFESYGHPTVRALSRASRAYFEDPPQGTVDAPILSPRGALVVAPPDQTAALAAEITEARSHGTDIRELTPDECTEIVPVLCTDLIAAASYEPGAADMDVAAIHQSFVRTFRRHGGEIVTTARVRDMERRGLGWTVRTENGDSYEAPIVVNAAGAWCDVVGTLAGANPIGLVPKRRTAFMVGAPPDSTHWPLTVDAHHTFYFKPDGPQLLCSPADETPTEPQDARPEDIDIALAIERINEMTTLGIRSVRSAWAGLRSFVADGGMVIGFDPDVDGFFWLAGQGGTGIQTSPAAGALAADLVRGVPSRIGVDLAAFSPARLRG
ncbi:MAG: NAD(P)/FAD-dependent oxidoreductase [Acidimicrobiia bacterium]